MQKNTDSLFDGIAESYYTLTPTLPEKYIQLLQETFHISKNDAIIDLGCGSGDLVLSLTQYSSFVEGLDESKTMITMAKEKDAEKKATWIHESVNDFDFGEERYNLIVSFESFHLFPHQPELIKRIAKSLKSGGALCTGWRTYAFDIPLRAALEETFSKYNIPFDWGYWTCPNLSRMVSEANVGFSQLERKDIEVATRISTKTIIDYIFTISHSATFSKSLKQKLSQELWEKISEIYPLGECVGYDQFTAVYFKK